MEKRLSPIRQNTTKDNRHIVVRMAGRLQKEQRTYRNHLTTKGVPGDPMFPGFKDVTKDYPGTLNYFNNTEPKVSSEDV